MQNIHGHADLIATKSAVDAQGALRAPSIDGVRLRCTRPVPHEDGHLTEIARASWTELSDPVVQVHVSSVLPNRVHGWALHQRCTDRMFVVTGLVKFVVFDGRQNSPTFGSFVDITLSEKSPGLLFIAPGLYHGMKNMGTSEAMVINMPTEMFDYNAPDSFDLPWDSEAAKRIIPYAW